MGLIEDLKWRYATKKYSSEKVTADDLNQILKTISLSASSVGIQPYRIIVVDDSILKKELGEGSFNTQIAECSHLLVFAAFKSIAKSDIEEYINLISKIRETPVVELENFKKSISTYLLARTDNENFNWSSKQAYIGLGTGLIAAAELKVDSTPMEGFDSDKFDELLGLKEKNLKSVVLLALGYRDQENDYLAKLEKVRRPLKDFAFEVINNN